MDDHNSRMVHDHIDRLTALEAVARDFEIWRAAIMVDHVMLKDGVANFRTFKDRGNRFFDMVEAKFADDEKRRKLNRWRLGIGAVILAAIIGVEGDRVTRAFTQIIEFQQEWKQTHPSEFKQQKSIVTPEPWVYAESNKQDAGGLPPVHF